MATTAWSATYNGIGGGTGEMPASTIGINPLPLEIQEQWESARRYASRLMIGDKVVGVGPTQKYNVVLSGAADRGHLGANTLSIQITQV